MSVYTVKGQEYPTISRDSLDKFHGNQVVYIYWYGHVMVSSPMAFPLSPDMLFGDFVKDIVTTTYAPIEPDFKNLDFAKTQIIWRIDDKVVTPDFGKSLKDNGINHKSFVEFETPTLIGKLGA